MNSIWQMRSLASVAEKITDGSHNPPKGIEHSDYLMLSSKNVFDDCLHFEAPRYLTAEQFEQEDRRTGVSAGDVLLTIVGTIGRCAVVPAGAPRITLQRSVAVVRPRAGVVDSRFLMYSLLAGNPELNAAARGVAQKGVYLETLRALDVPVPPISEQQRIVAILDEVFEGIAVAKANAEQNVENARAIFESRLSEVFLDVAEWECSTIEDVIKFIDYRGKTPTKTSTGLRLITAKNVKMGYLQDHPKEYVAPDSYDSWMTRGIPQRGDVLFTTEAPLANVAVLDTEEKVVFAQRIIIMQADESRLDGAFLKYMLLSHPVQQRIKARATGATVSGIKASLLKTVDISFPELADQLGLVGELDSLSAETNRLESVYKQKAESLEGLKKSLLNEAFAGNL